MTGPLLSDAELFSALDQKQPLLKRARELFAAEETEPARECLARSIRDGLDPDKFFSVQKGDEKPQPEETLLKRAEDALAHNMCSVGTYMKFDGEVDWFANPTYNQYKEWTWQLSRHAEILTLARAYRRTGEEKYAKGAVELLTGWLRQAVRPDASVGAHDTLCWRTIECGIRMYRWPEILHSLLPSPALTDEVLIDIYKSLYEHAVRLRLHPTKGNWQIMQLDGLVHIAIVAPVFAEAETWLAEAVAALEDELALQIFPEGMQYEMTTNYQLVLIYNTKNVIDILETYDRPVPKSLLSTFERMMGVYIPLLQSGRLIPNLNDGKHGHIREFLKHLGGRCADNPYFRYFLSDEREGHLPTYTSIHLPYMGFLVFRESWEKNAVTGLFDAGKFGRAHQHEDKLGLLLYAKGKALLTEGNTYAYDGSEMRKYSLSSFAHNTAVIDGLSQNRKKNYTWHDEDLLTREPLSVDITERVDRAVGVYDEGYGPEALPLARHTRFMAFLKKPKMGLPLLIVADTLESKTGDAHTYELLWHIDNPEMTLAGNIAETEDLRIFTAADCEALCVVKGQTKPTVQGFTMRSALQGDYYAIPTLITRSTGVRAKILTVLSVKEDGYSPVVSATLGSKSVTVRYENGEQDEISMLIE